MGLLGELRRTLGLEWVTCGTPILLFGPLQVVAEY